MEHLFPPALKSKMLNYLQICGKANFLSEALTTVDQPVSIMSRNRCDHSKEKEIGQAALSIAKTGDNET
jgi:hypothetical protein